MQKPMITSALAAALAAAALSAANISLVPGAAACSASRRPAVTRIARHHDLGLSASLLSADGPLGFVQVRRATSAWTSADAAGDFCASARLRLRVSQTEKGFARSVRQAYLNFFHRFSAFQVCVRSRWARARPRTARDPGYPRSPDRTGRAFPCVPEPCCRRSLPHIHPATPR